MFNILSKYILRNFFWCLVATTAALISLSMLIDILELLRRAYDKPDVTIFAIMKISATRMPSILSQIMPFCIVIATIITMWRMTKSNELIMYRAVGVSAWKFTAPIIVCAFLVGLFNTTIFNPFTVLMTEKYNQLLDRSGFSAETLPFISEDGFWMRETQEDMTHVIHSRSINLSGNDRITLENISIINIKNDYNLVSRIEASRGYMLDGIISIPTGIKISDNAEPSEINDYIIKTSIKINQLQDNLSSPENISFWRINRIIKFFEKTGFSVINHKLHFYYLLTYPLLLVAFSLTVIPFVLTTNQRKGKVLSRIVLAVMSSFALFFFSKITMAIGASSAIPPFLAVFIPIIIASFLSIAALMHFEDG